MTLTRNLADAHGTEGIRVNQFNVGWTLTPNEFELKMKEGLPEDWPSKVSRTFAPSGRLLSPEDIAWAAVYFLSDEAALINGAVLDVEQYPVIGRNPVKEDPAGTLHEAKASRIPQVLHGRTVRPSHHDYFRMDRAGVDAWRRRA